MRLRQLILCVSAQLILAGAASAATFDVTVLATDGWLDTGIPVVAGDFLTINASGSASPNGVDTS